MAAAVSGAPHGREATRIIRPDGLGPFRARPPLPVVLYLAAREGRLVRGPGGAFAVVEPPVARAAEWAATPIGSSALASLARWWDHLTFVVPPLVVLLVAVPVVLASPTGAVIVLVTAVAYLTLVMVVALGKLALRSLSGYGRRGDGPMGGELRSYHWTCTLCHVPDPAGLGPLLRAAVDRAASLTSTVLPEDRAFGTVLVGLRAAAVTTPAARRELSGLPDVRAVGEDDWYVVTRTGGVRPPRREAVKPVAMVRLLLLALVTAPAAMAQYVAETERQACLTESCAGRPVSFASAVGWLLRHAVGDFAGPATASSRTLGVLTMVFVPVMVVCVVLAVVQNVRYVAARRDLLYRDLESRSTVFVLVASATERDAVVDAVRAAAPETRPERGERGEHAVLRLGRLGATEVVLAQSEQGTVGAGAMTMTATALLANTDPRRTSVIVTGICYGLASRDLDGGDQEIGDVVVSKQLHLYDHRKVTVGPTGEPVETVRGASPEASPRLLSHARTLAGLWAGAPVHIGPVISLNTLLDNADARERLKASSPEALAGEMEAAGAYEAATAAHVGWLLVKGISDWGVDKSDDAQRSAARNAADFVVALIADLHHPDPLDP